MRISKICCTFYLAMVLCVGAVAAEPAHWSFIPPVRPAAPRSTPGGWSKNPIDDFILAGLKDSGLEPAPEADRPTLLRRVTFDLTGLPPTPAELDSFLSDEKPDAYERVVERLLASPRFGERWAQHWLDLARYADTDGFEFDQARPDAWRFRDWVVKSLNEDMPFDRFVSLQLAGDEVSPGDPDAVVATGWNRCYPDMVDLNDQGLRRQNALNDITETTGLAFLGLTIGCARCHDHKTDPIPQTDFYRLQAFFAPARFRDDMPVASVAERDAFSRRRARWDQEVASLRSKVVEIETDVREALAPGPPPGSDDETATAFQKPAKERTSKDTTLVFQAWQKDRRVRPSELFSRLTPKAKKGQTASLARLAELMAAEPRLPQARGVDEGGTTAPETYVLKRGEFGQQGQKVETGTPVVLAHGNSAALPIKPLGTSTGRRTALAGWLCRPDHPLTTRVIVNRLWQHHFGRGIVATPSDFGITGEPPSHPELLDWLATELVARGWKLKAIHRLMVTSATYRQSSRATPQALAADPDNELLTRFRRVRLDGEAIRDALLSASGSISSTMGGPAIFPELPAELMKLSSKGAVWPVSGTEEERSRRSLYVFVRRNLRFPFFEAFDRPDTNASCPKRGVTTIAPQALTLLNSKLAHDAAVLCAGRIGREVGKHPDDQIRLAFRLALGREPDRIEREKAKAFLDHDRSLERLCLALFNTNEFVYVD